MAIENKIKQALISLKLDQYDSINEELVEEQFLKEFVENNGDRKVLTGNKVLITTHLDYINENILGNKKSRGQSIIDEIENESKSDDEIWDSIKFFGLNNKVRLSNLIVEKAWTKKITSVEEYEKDIVNKHKQVLVANINNSNRVLHKFNGVEDNYRDEVESTNVINSKIDLTTSIDLEKSNKLFDSNSKIFVKSNIDDEEEVVERTTSNISNTRLMDEFEQKFNDLKNHAVNSAPVNNKNFNTKPIVDSGIKEENVSSTAKVITLSKSHTKRNPAVLANNGYKYILNCDRDVPAGIKVQLGSTYEVGTKRYVNGRVLPEKDNIDLFNKKASHMESQKSSNEIAIILLVLFLIIISFVVAPILYEYIFEELFTSIDFDTALNKKLYM